MSGTVEEVKDGERIGMSFWHGSLNHPVYGKAEDLGGVIPLLLPQGGYKVPAIVTDKPRLDNLVKKLTAEHHDLWEDELEDVVAAKVKEYMFVVAFTNPQDDAETPGMLAMISKGIVIFAIDDILDQLGDVAEHGVTYSKVGKLLEMYSRVLDGIYTRIEDIPNFLPVLQSTIGYFWRACRKLEDVVPNFRSRNCYMREEWTRCSVGFILLMEKNPPGEEFSEKSLKVYGAYNSGMIMDLEIMAMLRNVTLRPDVRQDILLQHIRYQVGSVSTLMNALFGFARDVNLNQVQDSSILRQVVQKGVSLEKAFNEALSTLCEEMNDIRVGIRKLRERYVEDKDLMDYVRLIENVVDGQIYCYGNTTRYGNLDMKVVKI